MLAIVGMASAPATIAKDGTNDLHWVGTWSASPQAASNPVEFKAQTIRQIVRVSIGGKRVRVLRDRTEGFSALRQWKDGFIARALRRGQNDSTRF